MWRGIWLSRKQRVIFPTANWQVWYQSCSPSTIGSLSIHDDYSGKKNVNNLHIWQWKTVVLHVLYVHFSFLYVSRCTRSFHDMKWPVLQLCEHMITNVQFCLLISEALVLQFNSTIVRAHFAILNNWGMVCNLEKLRDDCGNAKLHFQMTFSLGSTSCLLKLSNIYAVLATDFRVVSIRALFVHLNF